MDAEKLHRDSIVIDAVAPLLQKKHYIDAYITGGVTCVAPTVGAGQDSPGTAIASIGSWINFIKSRDDLLLIKSAADVELAKKNSKIGILFHFQGTGPFETNLDLVDAFQALGVGIVQLTYNKRDFVGDGCEEESNAGLSRFGKDLIRRLNDCRVIVDCTHTAYRTTMDALSLSSRPAVFSHSNASALFPSGRNIVDEQAKAAAATGGLVGVTAVPQFVVPANGSAARPTLEDLIAHIDHFVSLIGIDHVALGLDYYWGTLPFSDEETVVGVWERCIAEGKWSEAVYPKPPHYNPPEIDTPDMLANLTAGLVRRGYKESDIRKILGLNWLRVYREVGGFEEVLPDARLPAFRASWAA